MRWAACILLLLFGVLVLGCGDSGSPPATASAGRAPPGPGGPPAPGGDAPAVPPETPPAAETPPAESTPAAENTPPAETAAAGESANGEGAAPGGDPNNNGSSSGEANSGDASTGDSNSGNANPGDDPNTSAPARPRRPPQPRTLKDEAFAAFRMGNDVEGMKLLNAHFAAVPAAKEELMEKMAWYPALMRPALAPRIGVGIHITEQPLNFKGDPMPIGSASLTTAVDQMQQAEASDRSIGRTGRTSKFGRGRQGATLDYSEKSKTDQTANLPGDLQLNHYLGDFGDWFIDALKERMESGDYGAMTQELMRQAARAPAPRRDPNDPNAPPPEGQPDLAGGEGGEGALPLPGGGGGRGRGGRGGGMAGGGPARGGIGSGVAGAGAVGSDKSSRWAAKSDSKGSVNLAPVKQILPCMLWLGKADPDDREDLVKRAEALNVDILAIFSVTLHQARTGNFLNNKALLRLVNMRTGKAVANYSPEPIVNLDVERWRQKNEKGADPVEKEILKMLEAIDSVLKPAPLPEAVTAERAKKRIEALVAAKPEEPLPVIVEARYYFAKGLLGQDDYLEAARTLLGEEGFAKLAARAKSPAGQ